MSLGGLILIGVLSCRPYSKALEHPQQVFCKADFGEFCASLKILRDHGSAKVAMTMCQFRVYRDPRLLFYVAIFNRQPARLKRVL